MKYAILLIALVTTTAQAWDTLGDGYTYGRRNQFDTWNPGHSPYGQALRDNYLQKLNRPKITHSTPNIFGGEDFYGNQGYMGHSQPNIFGGRNFHWNY